MVTLAGPARLSYVDIDTGYFRGNAPGRVRLSGRVDEESPWQQLLPESAVIPDSHNRFRLVGGNIVSAVRVDVFPDGGFSRRHLIAELADEALAGAIANWLRLLPAAAYARMLTTAGIDQAPVRTLSAEQLRSLAR